MYMYVLHIWIWTVLGGEKYDLRKSAINRKVDVVVGMYVYVYIYIYK
jgi:hypothetical protein